MQPYFHPYAGYFRLLAAADLFVIYDCVQFPRRGWVHRNRLPNAAGAPQWLTLPLAKAPQTALIRELTFRPDAAVELGAQMQRFPILARPGPDPHGLVDALRDIGGTPVDYIERQLRRSAQLLGLAWCTLRSSSLDIPRDIAGQERILAIAQTLGATCYVNPPGGRALYDPRHFAAAGITLRFLPDYQGSFSSILERLLEEPAADLGDEIRRNTRLVD